MPKYLKQLAVFQYQVYEVLAYVTNVLVKMNIFTTRCMLFYFAKTIGFVSRGNVFLFVYTFQQSQPFLLQQVLNDHFVHNVLFQQNITYEVLFNC